MSNHLGGGRASDATDRPRPQGVNMQPLCKNHHFNLTTKASNHHHQVTSVKVISSILALATISQLVLCQDAEDLRITNRLATSNIQQLSQGSQQQPTNSHQSSQTQMPPVILNKPEEIIVAPGSNVTLACSARGSPPLSFIWFQDEKNVTGTPKSSSSSSDQQNESQPSTNLLKESRYQIQEEISSPDITTSILYLIDLKPSDTSVFLCWVENKYGYMVGNFSLIITEPPPRTSMSAIGTHIIVVILLTFLLTATIICLLVLKATGSRSSKSSKSSDIKKDQGDNTPIKDMPSNEYQTMAVGELDGFMKQLRSGIINIENHSMSPALPFNTQQNNAQDHNSKIRQQAQWDLRQDYMAESEDDIQSQSDSAMTAQMIQMPLMQQQHQHIPYIQQQHPMQHMPHQQQPLSQAYHMSPAHHLQAGQRMPHMPQVSQIPSTLRQQPLLTPHHHQQQQQQLQSQEQHDLYTKYMMLTKKPEAVSQMPQSFI